jgi:hypothetical protein
MKARHATTTMRVLCLFATPLALCLICFASINSAAFARNNTEPIASPTPTVTAAGTASPAGAPTPKPTSPQTRPTAPKPNNTAGHTAGGANERSAAGDNEASDASRNETPASGGEQLNAGNAKNQNKATANNHSDDTAPQDSLLDTILYWGIRVLGVLGVLLVLGLIGYGVKLLIDGSRARTDGHFASVKKRQDEYARQTREAVAALDKSVNSRLAALQSEIKELRLTLQDDNRAILDGVRRAGASSAAYAGSSSGYVAQPARFEREEPAFPAAAEEYLNRSRRGAVVVKPDFQNGMLVQDTEGTGEFMLVRDYTAPDELLYVVPRIGYFQTKQDFYNYYDRYYECARPAAGTVWIVQPAVVDRVSGGWTLREKGELEVR